MKTTRYILCLAAAALLAGGCGKFVRDELITMQNEIDQLHRQVADMNEAMVSLRAIVNEMAAGGYVVEVKEFTGEDGRGGYTLVFNDGSLMNLYSGVDGRDGQDAVPPVIGLQQDAEDGEWYWTLDGEWILSPEGDRFKAVGVDGITPQLDVRQSEDVDEMHWFMSMDDGETWEDTGYKAKGEDAVEVFSAIEVLDDRVVLTLASDGSVVELPRTGKLAFNVEMVLNLEGEEQTIGEGETLPVRYQLEGDVTETTLLAAGTDGRYKTRVERTSGTEGVVYVTAPDPFEEGYVYLTVSDGKGYAKVRMLNFHKRVFLLPAGSEYAAPAAGTVVPVDFKANFKHVLTYSEGASDWIQPMTTETRTVYTISDTMAFKVAENTGTETRTAIIHIHPEENPEFEVATVTIVQEGKPAEEGSGTGTGE
ncbi:MAG: hypothetical protein IJP73_00640 [Bacteroidales bacterium]|nr:hypothetical protein [Bacteroidales bacterium]